MKTNETAIWCEQQSRADVPAASVRAADEARIPKGRLNRRTTNSALLASVFALIADLFAVPASDAETTNKIPLAVWDTEIRASVGGGYRDNVALSSVAPEGSGFIMTTADASFIRLSETGRQLTVFLLGEDTRFLDSTAVDRNQFFSGSADFLAPAGAHDEFGGQLFGLYQYQVLDVSDTEATLRRVLVEGYDFNLRPFWRHRFGPAWSLEVEGVADRQIYVRELDDSWEGAGRLSLVYTYGHKSEFSMAFQSLHRFYDQTEQFTGDGIAITNTSLVFWRPEISTRWRHYWDADRRWRTTTTARFLFNRDNDSGYFDYDRILFSEQLRWRNPRWEINANARLGWYFYHRQPSGAERRQWSRYELDLRVERKLGRHWFVYGTVGREWYLGNDPLDQYEDWMSGAGVGVVF